MIRGYPEVEELTKKSKATTKSAAAATPTSTVEETSDGNTSSDEEPLKEEERQHMESNEAEDYDNENSEEEVRKIDHLMFVIHG